VVDHGFSRIPVVGSGPDDVVGVIYAKDLLKLWDEQAGTTSVTALMRPPYFVPETKLVPDLLRDMQLYKTHLAVVVDEFGGTAGLVTIEDILEELVGEIVDEYDVEESLVVAVEDGWVVDGRLNVDDLNDLLDTEFPDSEWDTIAGLILELAGRVPLEGEEFAHGDLILSAERIQGRRVGRVRIRRARLGTPKLEQA
jgi:magnesium and cobalt transporter